jgi:SAM-dependent methyltransferase
MRLLDCGCGPGSITLGLATVVAPGEVVGIDLDPGSIEVARKQATEQQITNVRFEVANVYELPFPSASFDVIFSHAVLMHVRQPVSALKEMKRVLKRGGLIGIRNDDLDGMLMAPPDPLLVQYWELMAALMAHHGGDARGAKHSAAWLRAAGFTGIEASASYECYGTPAETAWWSGLCIPATRNLQPRLAELGLADQETVERCCAAWHTWGSHPDAFFAKAWCEAIGWVE